MASAVVVGAGPGIGAAVAARLAREGLAVTVVARSPGTVRDVTERIGRGGGTVRGLIADSTDEKALRAALDTAASADGPVELLV
ncbi:MULTISPECIES: SDR family NAD(P)-dependent oxidoreductase [Streptomyces]|uniref:SDR family NAD(P)-dependent oxidoreductase n=1 Tax=Streptomyces evansiae TaxID=3075535 RepID=A0ABU2R3T1_9ACTN|nr:MULTISPECIES: SDR family NAD(P)-dependent oxidoreductase [unclassified Streptomyces]MDT0410911.1 SDR family NAD(P)-dependent oxidoreductase [Streptomyces sp. DSM 41979]MYQ59814.1 SDR family NAD(P)-dependent oxidoreductase [Streptomyces sp. SID4926]SCE22706.1 short chain dehydrogenase [Streptomyces sp. DfronAA-171]